MNNFLIFDPAGIISCICLVLYIIVFFNLFKLEKEKGWKIFIPFYGSFVKFNLFFNLIAAIIDLLLKLIIIGIGSYCLVSFFTLAQSHSNIITLDKFILSLGSFLIIVYACLLIIGILNIILSAKIGLKYNKSILFILGLIFLFPIFGLLLIQENKLTNQNSVENKQENKQEDNTQN